MNAIPEAQTSTLQKEVESLRRMGERKFDRTPLSYAYGYDLSEHRADRSRLDFLFWIFSEKETGADRLQVEIDAYAAIFGAQPGATFDVDRWGCMKIHFEAPPTKDGFRQLSRIARALLNGRKVALHFLNGSFTGTLVHHTWTDGWTTKPKECKFSREVYQ